VGIAELGKWCLINEMQCSKVSLCKFVKNVCCFGFVVLSLNEPSLADVVLFEDSFDGSSIDIDKWMVGTAEQANGRISGTIIAKPAFTSPYEIFGRITLPVSNLAPQFVVHLRSSGWNYNSTDVPSFEISGIALAFANITPDGLGDVLILSDPWQSPNPLAPPFFTSHGPISWNTNQENEIHIIDDGSAIKLFVNNLEIFNVTTDYSVGSYVGFSALDSFLSNVEINSVPEPSSLSLLAVGLGGWALVRRRRS